MTSDLKTEYPTVMISDAEKNNCMINKCNKWIIEKNVFPKHKTVNKGSHMQLFAVD